VTAYVPIFAVIVVTEAVPVNEIFIALKLRIQVLNIIAIRTRSSSRWLRAPSWAVIEEITLLQKVC
jgi:hypothetical protein